MHAQQQQQQQQQSSAPEENEPDVIGPAALWEERLWHDGRTYYLNRSSREKQWNRPHEEVVPLSTMWIQRQDSQTGRYYYFNNESKLTQWKPPAEVLSPTLLHSYALNTLTLLIRLRS